MKVMLFSVEQAFVGRDEKRAALKKPAWEASPPAETRKFGFMAHLRGKAE